jgi:hypothetical protein
MGVPLLFCVGACHPKVTAELEAGVLGGGAVVDELPPVVVVVVPEPVSATVCGGVELVVLVVAPAPDAPDSSSPQAASAIASVPTNAIPNNRPDPSPRSAFCMQTPDSHSNAGRAGHEVTINRLHERAAQRQLCRSHEADAIAPATPLS